MSSLSLTRQPFEELLYGLLREAYRSASRSPFVLGLCGAQGSGKSTLAARLARRFREDAIAAAVLSLDDIYLTKAERAVLRRDVHPLLATRGVPGTHDVDLGIRLLESIGAGIPTPLPSFDKLADDRLDQSHWGLAPADTRIVIFEGWCVGARAQIGEELARPINALEERADQHGIWRSFVNRALGGCYQTLFQRIDFLTLLAAPEFDVVKDWRYEQELTLSRGIVRRHGRSMTPAEILVFVQHYERLTRHILREMPSRADLLIDLAADRSPIKVVLRS